MIIVAMAVMMSHGAVVLQRTLRVHSWLSGTQYVNVFTKNAYFYINY
jgi:hypothetical protein